MRTSPSPSPPFTLVGRDHGLGILRRHLDAALTGQGSLVLISGEAGIGKTALAEAVCREATEQGVLVLVGRCYDLTETPPYGPWVELLGRYPRHDELPSLPDAFAQRGTVGEVTSQAALFQQVLAFFAVLAALQPIILLLDDLHWADPASLDLLRVVARSASALPLLILTTYRSEDLRDDHPLYRLLPLLVREANAERLDLRPLDEGAVRTLVDERYRLADGDADRLVAHLQGRAEGNALFLGELLRWLEEGGALRRDRGDWTLGPLADTPVPPLLRQVIDARVARFAMDIQRLLAVAAVVGPEVPYAVWATVAEVEGDKLLDVVAQAHAAQIMVENRDGTGAAFIHALIREALYERVRPSERRRWHRTAGEALTGLPDPSPDSIAYQFQQAGDGRAGQWLITAGERARRAYAWPTAVARFEAAWALMERQGADAVERGWLLYRLANLKTFADTAQAIAGMEEAQRLARMAGDHLLAAQSLVMRGSHRYLNGQVRQGLADLEAGVAALDALSAADRDRLARLDPIDRRGAGDASGRLCYYRAIAGYYREALTAGEKTRDTGAAASVRSEVLVASRYRGLGLAHAALGQPDQARDAFTREREARQATGDYLEAGLGALNELRYVTLPYRADDLVRRRQLAAEAVGLYRRAVGYQPQVPPEIGRLPLLVIEGQWDEADAVASAVLAVGGHGAYMGHAQSVFAPLARERGETAQARAVILAVLPAGPATPPGETPWFRDALTLLHLAAALAVDAGELAVARAWLEAYDRWVSWSGTVLGRAESQLGWATYHRVLGDGERARRHAEQALTDAAQPAQPLALIAAHRLVAELGSDAAYYADAESHLGESLALAAACAAPYERALSLLALAELRAASGEAASARTPLDEATAICTALGAQPALTRADGLRERLDVATQPVPTYPAGLSAREVEVLRLVAQGRTNRDIADTLFLSEHTVRSHVRSILTKTDTANRTGAALFAREHGLA